MINSSSQKLVSKSTLFDGLSEVQISEIIKIAEDVSFNAGQSIMEEGDENQDIYILVEGKVSIEKKAGAWVTVKIAISQQIGMMLGEMALIDNKPRSATVRAETPVRLVSLGREKLEKFFEGNPEAMATIALNIARTLSNRLRHSNEMITDYLTHHAT